MRVPMLAGSIACLLALAGCGESARQEGRLLTDRESQALLRFVDGAESAVNDGECREARERARDGEDQAEDLSRRVNRELRDNLVDWFEHLEAQIAAECERDEPDETPTPDETEEPVPTPTATATAVPTPTETAAPTPTATASPDATPDTGGAQDPGDAGDADGEPGDG